MSTNPKLGSWCMIEWPRTPRDTNKEEVVPFFPLDIAEKLITAVKYRDVFNLSRPVLVSIIYAFRGMSVECFSPCKTRFVWSLPFTSKTPIPGSHGNASRGSN